MRPTYGERFGNPQISKNDHNFMPSDEEYPTKIEAQKILAKITDSIYQKLTKQEKK